MKTTKQKFATVGALALMVASLGLAPAAKAAEGPSDPQIVGIVLAAGLTPAPITQPCTREFTVQ